MLGGGGSRLSHTLLEIAGVDAFESRAGRRTPISQPGSVSVFGRQAR